MHKYLKRIKNVFMFALIVIIVITSYTVISFKINPYNVPSIFGLRAMSILTGSMIPALYPGDMIITKDIKAEDISIGDILTFRVREDVFYTHRVIYIIKKEGKYFFKTKGDANKGEDKILISSDRLLGVTIASIPNGGYIINVITTPVGFCFLVFVTLVLLISKKFKE